ncbi:MAG: ABC transporter permease [Thermoanaerobaculia bacterium]
MLVTEIFRVALEAVRANKLRSFLTALGIIIGISAVIAMVALGEGAQRNVQAQLQSLGVNTLVVRPGQEFFGGVDRGDAKLTVKDAQALLREPKAILDASPITQRRIQVEYLGGNGNINVSGSWPSYFSIENFRISSGRLFNENEERGRRRVAVLGATAGDALKTSSAALLGKSIRIQGVPFEVIGVLEAKGSAGFQNPDDGIYIPFSTAQFRVFGSDRVQSIEVQAAGSSQMDAALAEIDHVLRREHRRRATQTSDFTIRNQTTLVQTFQETTKTFSFLLAGIALVSLLVGGIGIMNIMLASVLERTREIGVRRAIGADKGDICLQFLVESFSISALGGLAGVAIGVAIARSVSFYAKWPTVVTVTSIALAITVSLAVGVLSGLYPALRAAKVQPIQALRYE